MCWMSPVHLDHVASRLKVVMVTVWVSPFVYTCCVSQLCNRGVLDGALLLARRALNMMNGHMCVCELKAKACLTWKPFALPKA